MKLIPLALVLLIAIVFTDAIPIGDPSPGIIRLPLTRKTRLSNGISKRGEPGTFQADIFSVLGALYFVHLDIGTPPQRFSLALDTGSTDTWIQSAKCPSNICRDTKFDEKKSLTYTPTDQNFTAPYVSGNVSGIFGTDTMSFGGVSIKNQPFGLASMLHLAGFSGQYNKTIPRLDPSPDALKYEDVAFDGLLGLAFPSLSEFNNSNGDGTGYGALIFNMIDQKLIAEPIFSVRLGNPNTMTNSGEVLLGGIDSAQYTGKLLYSNITQFKPFRNPSPNTGDLASAYINYFFWASFTRSITIQHNGATIDAGMPKDTAFTFDTGASLSYLPRKVIENILYSVVGPDGYKFDDKSLAFFLDCNSRHLDVSIQFNLADFSNTSSSTTISIPFRDLLYSGDINSIEESSTCYFGIVASPPSIEEDFLSCIIGNTILRFLYIVHDIGQKRIGFANAIGNNVTVY
ncbi:aspartic peptidase domain-containing protein [Phycomyces nitens]|nr:aspartic peptidase domain-containing protein [Phycomyces nitens]